MPNRDPDVRVTTLEALAIILIIAGVAAVIYATGRTAGVDIGRNEIDAREHYEAVKENALANCVDFEPTALRKCVIEAAETAQNQSESRQDLYAQQDMSRWAFAMMIISGLTMFITGLGIVWIRATLIETRRAVKAADDAVTVSKEIGDEQIKVSNAAILVAQEANQVAIQQFTLGFKPQLILHLDGPYIDEARYPLRQFQEDEDARWTCIEIAIEVENAGKTIATITGFFAGTTGSDKFEIGGPTNQKAFVQLPPNRRIHLNQHIGYLGGNELIPADMAAKHIEIGHLNLANAGSFYLTPENRDLFMRDRPKVFGWIDYVDQLQVKRRLGFGLETIGWSGQVKVWGGDEYNYDREIK